MSTGATATVRCPRCGTPQPAERDFCLGEFDGAPCREYLGWSQRGDVEPATEDAPAPAAPAEAAVQMTVAFTGIDRLPDGSLVANVIPGDRVGLDVTVRNVGSIVDTFSISVRGLPAGWVQPVTGTARLVPIGHDGRLECKLHFVVHPPRDCSATAGTWPVTIVARSETRATTLAREPASLAVEPFFAVIATARPQIARGRRKARVWCDVRNNANAPIAPTLVPTDSLGTCTFSAPDGLAAVAPGQTLSLPLDVRAPRQLIGRPIDHQLQIAVAVDGLDPPTPPLLVTFRQRPLIPWWVPVAILLLASLAAALYAAWPRKPKKVTMPDVVPSSSVFVAQRQLQRAGLKGTPKVLTRVDSTVKAGTVIDQDPAAFRRVDPGVPLQLRVSVPATYTVIPDLTGMTVGKAEDLLHRRYLKLGKVVPADAPPTRTIAGQVPLAGRARSRDITAVDVLLAGPGKVKVPNVVCKTFGQAEKLLTPAGLKLATPATAVTSTQKARGQVPAAGSRRPLGTAVTLLFTGSAKRCAKASKAAKSGGGSSSSTTTTGSSAGPTGSQAAGGPAVGAADPVAYDDGPSVRMPGRGGPLQAGQQPAWSPDGALLAVRSGSQIRIADAASPADETAVSVDPEVPSAPEFDPTQEAAPLVAFIATPQAGSSEVCFARATRGAPPRSCLALADLRARSLAWSPDGGTILVVGARLGEPERPGVLRLQLRAAGADPASASSWRADRHLRRPRVNDRTGEVFDIAYDPRSARLAVITNLARDGARSLPQVVLVRSAEWPDLIDARWLDLTGCQLAWSPGGSRLAVATPDPLTGCPARGRPGRLVTIAADAPARPRELAVRARDPAWRP
jgi:beta-lactam-binding protein with PASTA domain